MRMLLSLFKSVGFKRQLASVLSVVLGLASMFPGAQSVVDAVQAIASFFGVTGLLHATAVGTLAKNQIGNAVSLISLLITLSHFIPALTPYVGTLQYIATILGAAAVGTTLPVKAKN